MIATANRVELSHRIRLGMARSNILNALESAPTGIRIADLFGKMDASASDFMMALGVCIREGSVVMSENIVWLCENPRDVDLGAAGPA